MSTTSRCSQPSVATVCSSLFSTCDVTNVGLGKLRVTRICNVEEDSSELRFPSLHRFCNRQVTKHGQTCSLWLTSILQDRTKARQLPHGWPRYTWSTTGSGYLRYSYCSSMTFQEMMPPGEYTVPLPPPRLGKTAGRKRQHSAGKGLHILYLHLKAVCQNLLLFSIPNSLAHSGCTSTFAADLQE